MIKVLDNVVSEKYSQFLFDSIAKLKWTFVPNLSYGESDDYSSAGFSFNFYLNENYNHKEKKDLVTREYNYVIPMILEAFDKFQINLDIDSVFRSRARLTLNRDSSKIEDKHIDYSFPHLVLLYYVNTTDGDTVLFDNQNNIVEKISPRRGRAVLFDGLINHASSCSTLSPRLVLNTNININK